MNLEREEREPADGEDGNDDEEHAYNAFPLAESLGVEAGGREFTGCSVEPQRVRDTSVRHKHRQYLHRAVASFALIFFLLLLLNTLCVNVLRTWVARFKRSLRLRWTVSLELSACRIT